MGNINDRKDKAGGRQLAEALVRDKGWGLPQNIEEEPTTE